jgi:ATP-dependent RNA helicase HelY
VASCPDRVAHVRAAVQVERIGRELADLDRRIGSSAGSVARRFDAVLGLLEAWGFVRDWALTDRGELLVRTYHESDLLLAEAVARGLFDDLDPPEVAALASCVTYEHRSRIAPPPPWFPSREMRSRYEQLERIGRDLQAAERTAHLPETRLPDPTFVALAHAWASGTDLATVLDDEDLSGGDFVRNVRQLIDLLRQLAGSAPARETRRAADAGADALFRGVVAASSLIGSGIDDDEPIGPDD